nr:LLM class F420-dependent oxidoreductase [Kibdelosporangium sp. MJ126-NF4]CEL21607.1 putative N5, N10-methylenetetrahydromethanopterin reductase-related protein [Kibdelosporangium sp. MJ126-NF4]CTQ92388.1 putative N5, N10-methylenetetrahydromethanopterin reductase-related protein [Kibdelosporangium sp. MJ126-NF4]
MKFGISTFPSDDTIGPVDLGRAIEERGFDSVMVAEHSHIPASRETPYPMGGELPDVYYKSLDPFVTLGAVAAVTEKILLFTGIALLIQRDPIHTAKETATIDLISGGRFVLGVGAGWNREEMRNHGTDPSTRGALLDERIEAVRALWTQEPAEYHGKFVDFDPVHLRPKPVAKPHPPIYVGGDSDATVRRVARHGAGWLANAFPVEKLTTRIAQMRDAAGRDVPVTVFGAPIDVDLWRSYEGVGVERIGLFLPPSPRAETLRMLDEFAAKVAEFQRG